MHPTVSVFYLYIVSPHKERSPFNVLPPKIKVGNGYVEFYMTTWMDEEEIKC